MLSLLTVKTRFNYKPPPFSIQIVIQHIRHFPGSHASFIHRYQLHYISKLRLHKSSQIMFILHLVRLRDINLYTAHILLCIVQHIFYVIERLFCINLFATGSVIKMLIRRLDQITYLPSFLLEFSTVHPINKSKMDCKLFLDSIHPGMHLIKLVLISKSLTFPDTHLNQALDKTI